MPAIDEVLRAAGEIIDGDFVGVDAHELVKGGEDLAKMNGALGGFTAEAIRSADDLTGLETTASEQRATDAILDVNREQAIKDADIKVELLKHATSIAAQLKTGILNTSAEFFKAYYNVYGLDNDTARIRAQAYNAYYSALATYYNVEVSWEELRMKSESTAADTDMALDRNRISLYAENGAAAAHAQASRGFADIAASSANAAGTLVAQIETTGG